MTPFLIKCFSDREHTSGRGVTANLRCDATLLVLWSIPVWERFFQFLLRFLNSSEIETDTVNPVLSDHIKQDKCLAFQEGGCLLLYESSTESSCFHATISNCRSIAISISPKWMVYILALTGHLYSAKSSAHLGFRVNSVLATGCIPN